MNGTLVISRPRLRKTADGRCRSSVWGRSQFETLSNSKPLLAFLLLLVIHVGQPAPATGQAPDPRVTFARGAPAILDLPLLQSITCGEDVDDSASVQDSLLSPQGRFFAFTTRRRRGVYQWRRDTNTGFLRDGVRLALDREAEGGGDMFCSSDGRTLYHMSSGGLSIFNANDDRTGWASHKLISLREMDSAWELSSSKAGVLSPDHRFLYLFGRQQFALGLLERRPTGDLDYKIVLDCWSDHTTARGLFNYFCLSGDGRFGFFSHTSQRTVVCYRRNQERGVVVRVATINQSLLDKQEFKTVSFRQPMQLASSRSGDRLYISARGHLYTAAKEPDAEEWNIRHVYVYDIPLPGRSLRLFQELPRTALSSDNKILLVTRRAQRAIDVFYCHAERGVELLGILPVEYKAGPVMPFNAHISHDLRHIYLLDTNWKVRVFDAAPIVQMIRSREALAR